MFDAFPNISAQVSVSFSLSFPITVPIANVSVEMRVPYERYTISTRTVRIVVCKKDANSRHAKCENPGDHKSTLIVTPPLHPTSDISLR